MNALERLRELPDNFRAVDDPETAQALEVLLVAVDAAQEFATAAERFRKALALLAEDAK